MDHAFLKNYVRRLRARGYTFGEILNRANTRIPKSTLSYWCKNMRLPEYYYRRVALLNEQQRTRARAVMARRRNEERHVLLEAARGTGRALVWKMADADVQKIALAMLYLGEGSKSSGHKGLTLGSSNPDIIRLYITLLKRVYGIEVSSLHARIMYRADQNIIALTKFWSKVTGVPVKRFYKTKPDARTIGKTTKKPDYKGVCAISCAGVKIQLELEEIAKAIAMGL